MLFHRLLACALPLALCACQGMYLHSSDRAAAAATAKKDIESVDVASVVKTEQENLAQLLAEEAKSIEARSKLVATLSVLDLASSDESVASHYRSALQKMGLAFGNATMLKLRDQGDCEKKKANAAQQVPNLARQLQLLGAKEVPACGKLPAGGLPAPAGLSADDAKDFADTGALYAQQCSLRQAECRVAPKEADDLDKARKAKADRRNEAATLKTALDEATKQYKEAVQANQKKGQAGAEAEKDLRDKAKKVLDGIDKLAEKSPALANRAKGSALVDLLTAAASGNADASQPDLAAAMEAAKSFPALVGSIEKARAARETVPVSSLLLALNDLTVQAERDARLAALDDEEIAALQRKLEARTTQAGLWRRYSDQLCNLALYSADKKLPGKACDTLELSESGATCTIRFSADPKEPPRKVENCVLQRSWRALFDGNLDGAARRALYEAAAAYLHVRLIAYATTQEEFKRIDVEHRRVLVNREASLGQWRNLVAVPASELDGYYSGGIKPAELADLIVKIVGFTAIAIGVAQ